MTDDKLKLMSADAYVAAQQKHMDDVAKVSASVEPAGGLMTASEMELARDRHLASFGVSHKTVEVPAHDKDGNPILDEDGNPVMQKQLVITKIPDETIKIMSFFTEAENYDCWFTGCEKLRAQYKADIEAAGGEGCTDCKRGAIIRKYMPMVRDAVRNDERAKTKTIDSPGAIRVPGPAKSSGNGAQESPGLLRRAASYLKKVFKPS